MIEVILTEPVQYDHRTIIVNADDVEVRDDMLILSKDCEIQAVFLREHVVGYICEGGRP